LYAVRPAASDDEAALIIEVFLTSGSAATSMRLVRTGRLSADLEIGVEEGVLSVCVGRVTGGWLMGWLEIVLMTRGRSWAEAAKADDKSKAHSDRYEIFFKFFKTSSS
jgi:hypothetical protein